MAKMTKEEAALLDAIARTESAGDWNVIYGGSEFSDYSKHPAKYVTIKSGPNKGRKSSAAGKYQITKTTYDAVAPKLGITDFSPESQQKIALYLAREKYGPNLAEDLANGNAADVAAKLAGVWTSLPGGIEAGTTSNKFLKSYAAALDAPRPPGFIGDVASEIDIGGGPSVKTYQQQLAQRGFDPGPVDGVRGPRTTAAVKAFQQANGLVADGIVGPKTMAALQGQQRPSTQPQPPVGARQPANILAPPPLIQPSDIRDAFFNPLPAPRPLTPPRPEGGMLGGRPASFIQAGAPPIPMPGRPASLNALPAMPGRAAPMPMPGRPAGLNGAPPMPPAMPAKTQTAAPPATPKLLRLPSGQMIAPGSYDNAKSGIPYTVTEGPNGTAVINSQRAGFVDLGREINAATVLGGIIRSKIPEGVQSAVQNFGPTIDSVKNTAANAINTAVPAVQGFGNQIGGLFGNIGGLFAGAPPAVPGPQFQPGMLGRGQPMRRAPMPLTPSPRLRMTGNTVVNKSGETYDQRRQRQIAEGKASQLDQFGMII